jgi:hypothetical protein
MANYPRVRCIKGRLTATQVNAASRKGTIVLDPDASRNVVVLSAWVRCIGSAAGVTTAVILTDTASSPVTVVSFPVASLTQNLVLRSTGLNVVNTNLGATLGTGKGLRIGCTVADLTVTTGLDYCVRYVYTDVNNILT